MTKYLLILSCICLIQIGCKESKTLQHATSNKNIEIDTFPRKDGGKSSVSSEENENQKLQSPSTVKEWYESEGDTVINGNKGFVETQKYRYSGNYTLRYKESKYESDEYNVKQRKLQFFDTIQGKLIEEIDLVKENPYTKIEGFKRRKEPYANSINYFLQKKGTETKVEMNKFLPKIIYDSIPDNFVFERAISSFFHFYTDDKYVVITYNLDWNWDAFSDKGEWSGNGYAVNTTIVRDSKGKEVYRNQFDGYAVSSPSVSGDGKYLMVLSNINPEWYENRLMKLTVVNIQTRKVVFEELIRDAQESSASGFTNLGGEQTFVRARIVLPNNTYKYYMVYKGQLFITHDIPKLKYRMVSDNRVKLIYPNKTEKFRRNEDFFQKIENLN